MGPVDRRCCKDRVRGAAAGRICRRIRRRGRRMRPGRSRSAISGSRRSRCRSGSGRSARPTQLPVLTMVTRVLAVAVGGADPVPAAPRICSPGWWQLIAALGAVPRVLVWDGEGAIGRWRAGQAGADRRLPGVPRHAGREGDRLQARRPGGQGPGRAGPRLPGALVPARPDVHRPGGLQHPAGRLAGAGQHPAAAGAGLRPGRPDRRGPAAMLALPPVAPATGWRSVGAAAPRPLRAAGLQRLLGPPGGDRPRGSRSPPTWTGSGCSATGRWSPTTSGAGPGTRPSPTPRTCAAARALRRERVTVAAAGRRSRGARSGRLADYDTALGIGADGRWRDGRRQDRRPGPDRRARVPDPGAEGPDAARVGAAGWPSGPGPSPGPTRSSWPPACSARSPPASPTAARAASAPPGSRPARSWRSSTSTTPAACKRDIIAHLGTLDFVTAKENVVFLGPPGTGKTHLAIGLAIRACQAGHRVAVRHRRRVGRPPRRRPPRRAAAGRAGPARPLPAAGHRRGRLHPLRARGRQPVLPARLLPLRTGLA